MREKVSVFSMVRVAVCLLLMILSVAVISPITSNPETYRKTIEKLDEKKETVMEVTSIATVSSIGLAAFPDDATTPVANKIMDLAGYLVLVLCAIIMEKYLLTIIGYVAFHWMIPIALGIWGMNTFLKNETIAKVAAKLLFLSLALWMVIPMSVRFSDMIEKTYKISIEAEPETEVFSESTEVSSSEIMEEAISEVEEETAAQSEEMEAASEEENGSWFSQAMHSIGNAIDDAKNTSKELVDAAVETAEAAVSTVTNLTDEAIAKAQDMFWNLVETVVVLIVINCILPILVLMFSLWMVNLILGIQISMPDPRKFTGKMHFKTGDPS